MKLVELYMNHNDIGDEGAKALANAFLFDNQTLNTLELSHNRIMNEGGTSLAIALANNQTLTTLKL